MILDLIILAVLVIPMAMGLARGFLYRCVRAAGWLGALLAAAFLRRTLAEYLGESALGSMISDHLTERFAVSESAAEAAADGLPSIIGEGVVTAADQASEMFVQMLTGVLVNIISFFIIIVVIRFLFSFIIRRSSRRRKPGMVHGINRILGMVVGALEGLLFVFLLLALAVPIVNLGNTELSLWLMKNLQESFIAGTLYDGNLLLVMTGGLLS